LRKEIKPAWHLGPPNPPRHSHRKLFPSAIQVPPLAQGFDAQGSRASRLIKKSRFWSKKKNQMKRKAEKKLLWQASPVQLGVHLQRQTPLWRLQVPPFLHSGTQFEYTCAKKRQSAKKVNNFIVQWKRC